MPNSLQRILGFKECLALVIGSVIGSGIFMKPAIMAGQLQSAWLLIAVWIIAGFITLCGALTNAETAAMFPETGGQYVFLQKMYGKTFSFFYGWSAFSVINTAGNASIAYVCSQYIDFFLHLPELNSSIVNASQMHIPGIGKLIFLEHFYLKIVTILILAIFTFLNIRSTNWSAKTQNILSSLKIIAILLIILGALPSAFNNASNIEYHKSDFNLNTFMMALTGAFWAYDGWNNLGFVAGEIKNPQKNIPRAYFIGLLVCILSYVLLNLAYIFTLGIPTMPSSSFIASDAGTSIWLGSGAIIITIMVVLSTAGTVNSNVLSTSRVSYAWFKDNNFYPQLNIIHSRFQSPVFALSMNLLWSSVLIMTGSFDMLTDMLIFVTWFFYGMSALGVIILRFKMPDYPRIYKVWLYPIPTLIFIIFTFSYLIITIYNDVENYVNDKSPVIQSLLGLIICFSGLPLYFLRKKIR
ncbi:MAG: amino acid permease [Saprospiraceae bacterium]|nr:amino acid permease [Saprospiraceae bacterium]